MIDKLVTFLHREGRSEETIEQLLIRIERGDA